MNDETRYSKVTQWIKNNRVFSVFLVMAFMIPPLSVVFDTSHNIYTRFINKPFDEKVLELIDEGCILFLPDSTSPVNDKESITNAYRKYWRKIDIYYAPEIFITGHVHSRGSAEYNINYGEKRAHAASKFLEENARIIPESNEVHIISFGEERELVREGEYECGAKVTLLAPKV